MDRIPLPCGEEESLRVDFDAVGGLLDAVHLFGKKEIHAINAAIAAGRPLLVRGEPGSGKSQLARAAAKKLARAYVQYVVDAQSESRDLLWTFDAVRRLADAQISGSLPKRGPDRSRSRLATERYVSPGPLWWAFDWESAAKQARTVGTAAPPQREGGDWQNGTVFLLDEIDKAEPEVPNGLLEALGAREFTPLGFSSPVHARGVPPFVVITTNEERALPDAFVRRCLVLHLDLPKDDAALREFLVQRGRAHFPGAEETILRQASEMLTDDRAAAKKAQVTPHPGQAEYLDLLRAVLELAPGDPSGQEEMLAIVREYTLRKNPVSGLQL